MLRGEELLDKLHQLRGSSRSQLVRACGYVSQAPDGRMHLQFTSFYEAILEAKGIHLNRSAPSLLSRRSSKGRHLSFNTHVHFNGNLMVGRPYLEKLDLRPGDKFRIHLNGREIHLIPLHDQSLGLERQSSTVV